MSSVNSVRKLQILNFSKKNKKIKNLKNGDIYAFYSTHLPLPPSISF